MQRGAGGRALGRVEHVLQQQALRRDGRRGPQHALLQRQRLRARLQHHRARGHHGRRARQRACARAPTRAPQCCRPRQRAPARPVMCPSLRPRAHSSRHRRRPSNYQAKETGVPGMPGTGRPPAAMPPSAGGSAPTPGTPARRDISAARAFAVSFRPPCSSARARSRHEPHTTVMQRSAAPRARAQAQCMLDFGFAKQTLAAYARMHVQATSMLST